jgi:hypothetical protein
MVAAFPVERKDDRRSCPDVRSQPSRNRPSSIFAVVTDAPSPPPAPGAPVGAGPQAPVVLTFGLKPERLLDHEGRIDCFLEPPGPDQLDLLVKALRSGLEAGGALVAIVPEWFDPDGTMRLEMALSLVDSTRVALHRSPLPPLAGTVLASLASAAGPLAPSAGVLASLLGDLEARLQVVTWLGSVSGLTTPAPSVAQHLASMSPGSAFAVSSYPDLAVHRIHGGGIGGVPLPPVDPPARLAVSDHGGDQRFTAAVAQELGVELRAVPPTPGGEKWWGTGKLVEAVLYPADVQRLVADLLAGRDTWPCRWCGELVARSPCPMCGHRGGPPRRAQHGARR